MTYSRLNKTHQIKNFHLQKILIASLKSKTTQKKRKN